MNTIITIFAIFGLLSLLNITANRFFKTFNKLERFFATPYAKQEKIYYNVVGAKNNRDQFLEPEIKIPLRKPITSYTTTVCPKQIELYRTLMNLDGMTQHKAEWLILTHANTAIERFYPRDIKLVRVISRIMEELGYQEIKIPATRGSSMLSAYNELGENDSFYIVNTGSMCYAQYGVNSYSIHLARIDNAGKHIAEYGHYENYQVLRMYVKRFIVEDTFDNYETPDAELLLEEELLNL